MKASFRCYLSQVALVAIAGAASSRAEYLSDAHTLALWRFDRWEGQAIPGYGPDSLDLGGSPLALAASPEDSALVLDGTGGLSLPDSTRISVKSTGMLTYQARIWLDAYPPASNHNQNGFLMGKYEGMGLFIRSDGRIQINNQKGNGTSWMWYAPVTAKAAVPLKRWVEVAAACDQAASECYGYVDGKAQATYTYFVGESYSPLPAYAGKLFRSASSPLTVGYNAVDGQRFPGRIEAIKISDTLVYGQGPKSITTPPETPSDPGSPVPGAIARWDFEEGAGDTLHDRTGNGHHGIIQGARWAEGVKGHGLYFDGLGTVMVPGDSQTNTNKSMAVSLWLYQTGNGKRAPLVGWQKPTDYLNALLAINTRGWSQDLPGAVYVNMRSLGFTASEPSEVRERNSTPTEPGVTQGGRWNHILFSYDNAVRRLRIYANGKLCIERLLQPFTPTLDGNLYIGRTSPTSLEWDAGLGLVGTLDEMALYGRALTDAEVQALYGKPPVEAQNIHLGMKTHNVAAGDTVWVPLYITSDGKDSLSSLQFKLALDTSVAKLVDVKMGADAGPAWEVTGWNPVPDDTVAVALAGTKRLVGALEGELLRFKLKVVPGANQGASTMLTLADLVVDEGRQANVTHTPGRILVLTPGIKYGDVTGEGLVDRTDAGLILLHVVGKLSLPSEDFPAFTKAVADVSGNGEITAYDAALVLQYGLGIIEEFPVQAKPLAKRAASGRLSIAAATRLEGDVWRFRIRSEDLGGLKGGKLSFEGLGAVTSIVRVASPIAGMRASYSFDPATKRLDVALAGNRSLAAGPADFLEVDATYPAETSARGLTLRTADLNEGSLTAVGVGPETTPVADPAMASRPGEPLLFRDGSGIRFEVPGHALLEAEVLDIRGRRVAVQRHAAPVAAISFPRAALPPGILILRATGKDGSWTRILPAVAP